LHHKIVARNLPLQIDPTRDPTHHGLQREQGFNDALYNQRVIVTAHHMRRLVQADLVQFSLIQSPNKTPRKQDRWMSQTCDHGSRNFGRHGDPHVPSR
jgi:hypothetical protein